VAKVSLQSISGLKIINKNNMLRDTSRSHQTA
jgi:hypothetical protein